MRIICKSKENNKHDFSEKIISINYYFLISHVDKSSSRKQGFKIETQWCQWTVYNFINIYCRQSQRGLMCYFVENRSQIIYTALKQSDIEWQHCQLTTQFDFDQRDKFIKHFIFSHLNHFKLPPKKNTRRKQIKKYC